jgi:hypothetical protein
VTAYPAQDSLERSRAANAHDKLIALGLGYIAYATEHTAYFQLLFNGMLNRPDAPAELPAAATSAFVILRETVAQGIDAGELRKADPDVMTFTCWSLIHGFATLVTNGAIPGLTEGAEAAHATRRSPRRGHRSTQRHASGEQLIQRCCPRVPNRKVCARTISREFDWLLAHDAAARSCRQQCASTFHVLDRG